MDKFLIVPTAKFISEVKPVVKAALSECERVLRLRKKVQINLLHTTDQFVIKKMGGTTGFTPNAGTINISINTKTKGWKKSLKSTAAHEYNHAARLQATNTDPYEYSLRETIAFEGLAQVFEEELTGELPSHAKAISKEKARKLWKKIKPLLGKKDYDIYYRVFLKEKDKEFPHWGGYTLSYLIIKKRKEELGFGWNKLMKLNSKKLVGKGLD